MNDIYRTNVTVTTKYRTYSGVYNSEFNDPMKIFDSIINSNGDYILLEDITDMIVSFIKKDEIMGVDIKVDSIKQIQINTPQQGSTGETTQEIPVQ